MKLAHAAFLLIFGVSCLPAADDPSQVKDLRVLGITFEPPELMAPSCQALLDLQRGDGGPPDLSGFFVYATPIQMTWLILDPKGAGRDISWDVRACASQSDYKCENEGDFVKLASGTTKAGELKSTIRPGLSFVDVPADGGLGSPLLGEVASQDTFRGFGGFRMPIVLHLKAGTEETYAQKLMVFSCRAFPGMNPNVNPVLPGMTFTTNETRSRGTEDGGLWVEGQLPLFTGKDGGIRFEPLPTQPLQEAYVVPTFELKPLDLVEAWKISWHADLGRITPSQTGGVGLDGEEGKHRVFWSPLIAENTEQDVNFWMVVRDGRGGQTWIQRTAHWKP